MKTAEVPETAILILLCSSSSWSLCQSLIRNYNGFAVDMDYFVQVNLHFSQEIQCVWRVHGFFISTSYSFACVYPARCIHYAFWIFAESAPFSYMYAKCEVTRRPWDRQIGVKSASSPPRPKSAPRGSKSTTFAKGIFSFSTFEKSVWIQ